MLRKMSVSKKNRQIRTTRRREMARHNAKLRRDAAKGIRK